MAHQFAKDMVEAQEGRASTQIILTFVGGILLLTATFAHWAFDKDFYPNALGLMAALLLGVPLVVQAFKDLWSGHTHMDELAAVMILRSYLDANKPMVE